MHERDKFADFMLILLRMVLPRMPHLRVVLMSATLHVDLFANYFGGCPVIQASPPLPPSLSPLGETPNPRPFSNLESDP